MRFDSNKSRIILIVSVLFLAVSTLVALKYMSSHGATKITYELSEKFDVANKDTLILSTDDIRLFNGRNFIKYNPRSGETTKLLKNDIYSLANVQEVRWSRDGQKVAIKSGPQTSNSYLGQLLLERQMDLGTKHWWFIDLSGDKEFNPVNEVVGDAYWYNDELVLTPDATGIEYEDDSVNTVKYTIVAYKASSGTKRNVVDLEPHEVENIISVFDTLGSNLYYIKLVNAKYELNMVSKDGKNKVVLTNNNNNIQMTPDGSVAVYFEHESGKDIEEPGSGRPGKIYYRQLNSDKPVVLVKETFEGNHFVVSKDSSSLFVSEKQKNKVNFRQYQLGAKQDTSLITPSSQFDNDNLLRVEAIDDNGLALIGKNTVQFITKDPVEMKQTKTTVNAVKDSSRGFLLNQYKDGRIVVNIYQKPIKATIDRAIEYIKSEGVNPDLVKINFDTTNVE